MRRFASVAAALAVLGFGFVLAATPVAAYESVVPGATASISASVTTPGASVTLTVTYFQTANGSGIPNLNIAFFSLAPAGCGVTLGTTVGVTDAAGQAATPASFDASCSGQTIQLCGRNNSGLTVCASVLVLGFPNTVMALADSAVSWSGLPVWPLLSIVAGLLLIVGGAGSMLVRRAPRDRAPENALR